MPDRLAEIANLATDIEARLEGLEGNSAGQMESALVYVACTRASRDAVNKGPGLLVSLRDHLRRMAEMIDPTT